MRRKIFLKVLAVFIAFAFSVLLILGIVLPIFNGNDKSPSEAVNVQTKSRSAADIMPLESDSTYWDDYKGVVERFPLSTYTFGNDFIYSAKWDTGSEFKLIDFNFMVNGYLCRYMYFYISPGEFTFGVYIYGYLSEQDFDELDIVYNGEIQVSSEFLTLTVPASQQSYLVYLFLQDYATLDTSDYDTGYSQGYEQGKTDGYTNGYNTGKTDGEQEGYTNGYNVGLEQGTADGYNKGYNVGHTEGYNLGQTKQFSDPVGVFLPSVSAFLNTNFFGVISLGSVLSIVLFVSFAIIFIKMFAGG